MIRIVSYFLLTTLMFSNLCQLRAQEVNCSQVEFMHHPNKYLSFQNMAKIPITNINLIHETWCYSQKTNNDSLLTAVYRLYGERFYETFELAKAKKYLTLAVENAKKNNQIYHYNGALHMLGHTYLQLQNYDYALHLQKQFLEEAIKHDIAESISTGYIAVGYIYYKMGKYEKAKHYLQYAVDKFGNQEKNPYHFDANIRIALLYLGISYSKLGDLEKSEYFLEKSIQEYTKGADDSYGYLEIFLGNARFYIENNKIDKFNDIINRVEKMTDFEEVIDYQPRYTCTYYGLLGDYYIKKKDFKQAAYFHDMAFELSKSKRFYQSLLSSANFLIDYYDKQSKPVKDYYLNETQQFLFNMYHNNLSGAGFTNLSKTLQLESEKIGMLIKERDLLVQKGNFRFNIIVGLIFSLLLVIVALYFTFRYYRKTLSQKEEIQKVNQTLDKAYEELRLINDKLVRSNSDLYNFAAVIAHDLKSPLRSINFFSNELYRKLNPVIDKESDENFHLIISSAKKMTNLIEALLSFSKVTANLPAPNRVELKTILEDTQIFRGLNITHEVTIECDAYLGEIMGHETLLGQLFYNLISNAIKFTPFDRAPAIYVSLEHENQEELCISVKDNGVGISKNYLPYIFTIFKSYHQDNCRENEGSGIGLSICKRIVEYYNGKIWATSVVGRGTKVYFTLKKQFDDNKNIIDPQVKVPRLETVAAE